MGKTTLEDQKQPSRLLYTAHKIQKLSLSVVINLCILYVQDKNSNLSSAEKKRKKPCMYNFTKHSSFTVANVSFL